MPATLVQVSTSPGGMPKVARHAASVTIDGVDGDWQTNRKYHGGRDRAICLFSVELYDRLRAEFQIDLQAGSVGENFTTVGINLDALGPGDVLAVGPCRIRITKVREPCRSLSQWHPKLLKSMVGHSGWVCRVLDGGTVRPGDPVTVEGAN